MALDVGDRLKSAFTENFNLKLLSLGFALVLYSLVHGAQDAQRSVAVSLVVLLPPDSVNRVLVNQIPPQVRVTLRGPRPVLDDLRAEDIGNIQVDVHEGAEKRVSLDPSLVHVPANVRVEQIDPPVLDLQWEDRIVRDLPIQVSVVGAPAPGFVVQAAPIAEPTTVRVRGPQSELSLLQHIRADAFDVQGLTEGRYTRQLALDRPRGRVSLDATSVQVTATISRELVEKIFSKVPVHIIGPSRAKATPPEVDVKVVCPPEDVRGLRPDQLVVKVEIASKDPTGSASIAPSVVAERCRTQITPAQVYLKW